MKRDTSANDTKKHGANAGPDLAEVAFPAAELFQTLIDNLPQSIFFKDQNLVYRSINSVFAAEIGLPPAKILGKTDTDLLPQEAAEKNQAEDLRVLKSGHPETHEEIRVLSGKRRVMRVLKSPVFGDKGKPIGVLAIFKDITQRKRAADDLRKSEQEFRRVWEESLDGMRLTNEDGMTVRVNGAFCRMVGMSQEQMEGKPLSIIYQSDQDYIVGKHKERFAQRSIEPLFERELSLWHGKRVWFELSNSFIEVDGQPPHLLSIFRDVTERKLQEETLQDFAARLERSNRELQDFAYVASHDLQEPLRKVAVFGDRLKTKFGQALGSEGCDYLERMQKAATRMQKLIIDLLTFSRVTSKSQPFVEVDLTKLIGEVIGDLETSLEQASGTVEIEKLPVIEAEPLHMRQLFQNLIGNALKFHQPDVKPVIKIKSKVLKGKGPLGADLVEISVSDNGIGFDEKYLDRIFQVFQRLHSHAEYQGTGMGLAITRKIVEHHRGTITARSKPGEGATFIVTLPVKQFQNH